MLTLAKQTCKRIKRSTEAYSTFVCENMWGKGSSCPIKLKLQPRNSCPGKKPLALLSVTSVSRHISQALVSAKASNTTQPLLSRSKNLIYTSFLSLIPLSHPHPSLMFFCLGASACHPCIVLSGPWVNEDEGKYCYSERTHSLNAASTNKGTQKTIPICTVILCLPVPPLPHSVTLPYCLWSQTTREPNLPSPIIRQRPTSFMCLSNWETLYKCIILFSSLWRVYSTWVL